MEINSVCISIDRYMELMDAERQLEKTAGLLAETVEPLAEYKNMLMFFESFKSEKNLYEEFLKNEWMHPIKPSKDCLTAMAEVKWRDCRKAVDVE